MRFPAPLLLMALLFKMAGAQPLDGGTTIANPPEQPRPAPREPRPAEADKQIELDMKTLMSELNKALVNQWQIASYISGSRVGFFGASEWMAHFVATREKSQFQFDKIEIEKLEGDKARVKVSYSVSYLVREPFVAGGPPPLLKTVMNSQVETLELKREFLPWNKGAEKWRIVPSELKDDNFYNFLSLQNIAYFASQRPGTLTQLRGLISTQRLKQASLGIMQFVQDYDEQYLFSNEFWREAISPYVKSKVIFVIPGTEMPYTFNDNLSDKSLAAFDNVAKTVLLYEGEAQKPVFRYDGKAAIAFLDGHVEMVSPEDVENLVWKP